MIRFGVLGLGHIGKRHAQSISAHPGASLTHLADIKSQEECGATEFLENVTWFDSLDTLISSDDLPVDMMTFVHPTDYTLINVLNCLNQV